MKFWTFFFILFSAKSQSPDGQEFVDNFRSFDTKRWVADHGMLCSDYCIYLDKEYTRMDHEYRFQRSNVVISMKNTCVGAKCCADAVDRESFCTPYTGGQLTSKHTYKYGSFIFTALVADIFSGEEKDACMTFSCFSLEADDSEGGMLMTGMLMGISLCIPTCDPWSAQLSWQVGEDRDTLKVPLRFNAAKHLATYRIDWHPKAVKWFANGIEIGSIDANSMIPIPFKPMNIAVTLFPLSQSESIPRVIDVRMHLFRLRYEPMKTSENHTELLLRQHTTRNHFILICITLSISFTSLYLLFRSFRRFGALNEKKDVYIILES